MKASILVTVLSTLLLADSTVADPIPSYAKTQIEVDTHVVKRMENKAFGEKGWGPRYWAWSRVAYDYDWNSQQTLMPLSHSQQDGQDRDWHLLADHDIKIRGYASQDMGFEQPMGVVNPHMHVVVGVDRKEKEIVVAFKGTDGMFSAIQDLKAWRETDPNIAGKVEAGFYDSFMSVEHAVSKWLDEHIKENDKWPIVFAGHSLGGATALVATAYYLNRWSDLKDRMWVFSYGSPRAGDLDFQTYLGDQLGDRAYNFRHVNDPVPNMGPTDLGFANPSSRYVFDPDGEDDSWFDVANWYYEAEAGKQKAGIKNWVAKVRKTKNNREFHTGYFHEGKVPVKRDIEEEESVHKHQKRQAPTDEELKAADDEVAYMKDDSQFLEPTKEVPKTWYRVAEKLHFEGHEQELWEDIRELKDENERDAYMKIIRAFSAEQE